MKSLSKVWGDLGGKSSLEYGRKASVMSQQLERI